MATVLLITSGFGSAEVGALSVDVKFSPRKGRLAVDWLRKTLVD